MSIMTSSPPPNTLGTSISTGEIDDAAVTNAKMANMAQATAKGRAAGSGTGVPVDLTQAQLTALIVDMVLTQLAAQADQTLLANVVGSSASPTAQTFGAMSKLLGDQYFQKPTAAMRETFPRQFCTSESANAGATGIMRLTPITLFKGDVISSISLMSGGTAWTGATTPHRFFVLYDSASVLLAYTDDDGANAWGARAIKTLAITKNAAGGTISSYTVPTTGVYMIGVLSIFGSGASNSYTGMNSFAAPMALAPAIGHQVSTGLTDGPPPNPAGAFTATAIGSTYGYVS